MADHFFSPEARVDLLEIWEYIAQDNVSAADQVVIENQGSYYDARYQSGTRPPPQGLDFKIRPLLADLLLSHHLQSRHEPA